MQAGTYDHPEVDELTDAEMQQMMGLTEEQYTAYLSWCEESEAQYEAELVNGTIGPCTACGEYSVVESSVCTLGYVGHPGAEMSGLYTCINPDCQHVELA